MRAENPPTSDAGLSGYLVRMFNSVIDLVEAGRNVIVKTPVNNPQKGKLYFVEVVGLAQFPTKGVYYFNGSIFIKLQEA